MGADALADAVVPKLAWQQLEKAEMITFLVAMRLAILEEEARQGMDDKVRVKVPTEINEEHNLTAQTLMWNVEQSIRQAGHVLCVRGAFVHCVRCKRKKRFGNTSAWARTACNSGQALADKRDRAPLTSASNVNNRDEAPEYVLVTRARKRAMQRERAQLLKEQASKRQKVIEEAEEKLAESLCNNCQDFAGGEAEWDDIPFDIHPSHKDVNYLNGFVGCA